MGAISFNGSIYPAGSTQASDSIYDNTHTGLPANVQGAIDKTTGNISSLGTVELTATAAHTHAVGTYFIWIGQFVKVTSAIEVGDTIVDGTNVEATSIAEVLEAANVAISHSLKDNVGQQTIRYDNSGSTYSPAKLTLNQNDNFEATLKADGEGGNLRLRKYNCICELDTCGMSPNGDGAVRFYLNDGTPQTENHTTFYFNQNGSFTDGNGVNTKILDQRACTNPVEVMIYGISGIQSYIYVNTVGGAGIVFHMPYGAKYFVFDSDRDHGVQLGLADAEGTLPTIITTGAHRGVFINYLAKAGTNIIDISNYSIAPRFFIGTLDASTPFVMKNIKFIHEDF